MSNQKVSIITENFPTRIKNLRDTLGLTQTDFAGKLGISRNYVSMIEGGRMPSAGLMKLIQILEEQNGMADRTSPLSETPGHDDSLVTVMIDEIIEHSASLKALQGGRRRLKIAILKELLEQLKAKTPQ